MGCCVSSTEAEQSSTGRTEGSSSSAGYSSTDAEEASVNQSTTSAEVDEKRLEQEEVAIDHMRKWLSICDSSHECNRPDKDKENGKSHARAPLYLIDTENYCIVSDNAEKSYVALSYPWDKSSTQLLQRNREALLRPYALLIRERLISKVILEAIKMTKLLRLRYVWVDQLCIVQDEESAEKNEEISNMDHIYSGAAVTLVASERQGLFEGNFRNSVSNEISAPVSPSTIVQVSVSRRELDDKAILNHYTSISESTWATRGWTYQESILSKRIIFFHHDVVFWQCGCAVWDMDHLTPDEDTSISASDIAKRTLTRRFSTPSHLDFGLYMDLICPYNGRDFSREEDGLLACTGILNRLAPAFPEHVSFEKTLPLSSTPEGFFFPNGASRSSYNNGNTDDSGDCSKTERRTLGDGKLLRDELALLSCDTERAVFAPAAALEVFLVKPDDMMPSMDVFWDPAMNETALHQSSKVVVLQDQKGAFAGLVRVTENLDSERFEWTMRFPRGMKIEYGDGLLMEIIAVSEGTATRGDIKMCFEEKVFHRSPHYSGGRFKAKYDIDGWWTGFSECGPNNSGYAVLPSGGKWNENLGLPEEAANDDEVVEFYNVLWVQKGDDQISRRLGCGRVLKDRWRQSEPQIVSVTLG
ncbi:hypothetical protein CKAH01_11643 [Colletotrichum kahawae]|uniref:Heterokaryon incompatibility domain-containing protein n=1 Tax=Colletotrichum kahawae TaxID=34407 RepID=A0AAD9YVM8_COLKA|nr:hypothetical protein CKAH01_11643 [Colletotrichum kahawae]